MTLPFFVSETETFSILIMAYRTRLTVLPNQKPFHIVRHFLEHIALLASLHDDGRLSYVVGIIRSLEFNMLDCVRVRGTTLSATIPEQVCVLMAASCTDVSLVRKGHKAYNFNLTGLELAKG